jgi:AcrR family transcriptional regulator
VTDTAPRVSRARQESEDKLVQAAAELLGEVGPRAMSVRAVAERAGVNHGLVHHYFGGKDGLLRAAMKQLVEEHAEFARQQSGGSPVPAPLALTNDQRYLRAVVRSVLDDEMELARMELTEGVSVPRGALRHALEMRKMPAADAETKALLAISMAMEMGWAALEPFLFAVAEVDDADEQDKVRTIAREYRRRLAQGAFDGQP